MGESLDMLAAWVDCRQAIVCAHTVNVFVPEKDRLCVDIAPARAKISKCQHKVPKQGDCWNRGWLHDSWSTMQLNLLNCLNARCQGIAHSSDMHIHLLRLNNASRMQDFTYPQWA